MSSNKTQPTTALDAKALRAETLRVLDVAYQQNAPPDPASATTTNAASCERCQGVGFYKKAVPFGHADFGVLFPCECMQQQRAERARRQHGRLIAGLAQEIGEDLESCRLDTFDPTRGDTPESCATLAAALDAACRFVEHPHGWLVLVGPNGVGKSHLAAACALEIAATSPQVVRFVTEPALIAWLREGFRQPTTVDDRVLALQAVDVLVLDEYGVSYRSASNGLGWIDDQLYQILHRRYIEQLPTIITSNLRVSDFEPRIASRCRRGVIRELDNSDQREVRP